MIIKRFFIQLLLCATLFSGWSYAEAFGNNSLTVPRVGMTFFDNQLLWPNKPWGLFNQWHVGTSFMQAIDYRFWWVVETGIGFGKVKAQKNPNVATFSSGVGLRLNIFQEDFRPHVGMLIHYLQFLGEGARAIPLNLGWPIFVGLKPYFGLEWQFYSEMAFIVDAGYGFYVNINEPFLQALYANASFSFYF